MGLKELSLRENSAIQDEKTSPGLASLSELKPDTVQDQKPVEGLGLKEISLRENNAIQDEKTSPGLASLSELKPDTVQDQKPVVRLGLKAASPSNTESKLVTSPLQSIEPTQM